MLSETTNPGGPNPTSSVREKQKHLDHEIREMISALTKRLATLQHVEKAGDGVSSHHEEGGDDDRGLRIITLAGNNVGATMRGEMDEKAGHEGVMPMGEQEHEALSTYVNSNFQAINNSIMMGGSYSTNDPGVHMDIQDYIETPHEHELIGKKKKRGSSIIDQQYENTE